MLDFAALPVWARPDAITKYDGRSRIQGTAAVNNYSGELLRGDGGCLLVILPPRIPCSDNSIAAAITQEWSPPCFRRADPRSPLHVRAQPIVRESHSLTLDSELLWDLLRAFNAESDEGGLSLLRILPSSSVDEPVARCRQLARGGSVHS